MTQTTLFDEGFLQKLQRYLEQHNLVLVRKENARQIIKGKNHYEWIGLK